MSKKQIFTSGEVIGSYGIRYVKEAKIQKGHRRCIFICPSCGQEFENDLHSVKIGHTKTCHSCSYKPRTTRLPGEMFGKNHDVLMLERFNNNTVRLKCPKCQREDWIVDISSVNRVSMCYECYKKIRIEQYTSNTKYCVGDAVGPHKMVLLGYKMDGDNSGHTHGFFECPLCGDIFQSRVEHVQKGLITHCNKCKLHQSTGEHLIERFLLEYNIEYQPEKVFNDCINPNTGYPLRFDFYLSEYNCCIEYNGQQHYFPIEYFGGKDGLISLQYRDKFKRNYCKEHSIHIIDIKYDMSISEIESLLCDFLSLPNKNLLTSD